MIFWESVGSRAVAPHSSTPTGKSENYSRWHLPLLSRRHQGAQSGRERTGSGQLAQWGGTGELMNPSFLCRLEYFRDEIQDYQENTRVNDKQRLIVRTIRKLLHVT